MPLLAIVQPSEVCRVMALLVLSLTPSITSISPSFGCASQLPIHTNDGTNVSYDIFKANCLARYCANKRYGTGDSWRQTLPNQDQRASFKICQFTRPLLLSQTSLQGGPCATNTPRHMGKIKDEQAMIVRGSAGKPHATASAVRGRVGAVDAHIDLIVLDAD